MDYEQLELIAETNYLHFLWHLGSPRRLQPPYCHPQPPYYRPQPPCYHSRKRWDLHSSGNPPASSSEASPKPIFLPPPKKKCPSRGESIKETVNKGYISDVTVPSQVEVCEGKGKTDEIVKEGHMEDSMHLTEDSEDKGIAEEIVNEVNMEYSIPVTVVYEGEEGKEQGKKKAFHECEDGLVKANNMVGDEDLWLSDVQLLQAEKKKCPSRGESIKETASDGNINGSSDVTFPCHAEVWEGRCKTDEIVKEGHMAGSMHVTEVSEEKGKTEEIVSEVNMEYAKPVTVEFEVEEGKVEAKAFLECEDGLVDANNMVGDKDLCLSDVQLLHAEDIANEGHMEGSMHVTEVSEEKGKTEEIFNEANMKDSTADTVIPEVKLRKEQNEAEAKAVLESEDTLSDASNLLGGKELCLSDIQLLQDEVTVNDGDMKGSMDVIILGWGDVCEEKKSNAEETAHDRDQEGSMNATDSCQHDAWEAEVVVNEGEREGSVDVIVSYQGDTWKAEKIVEDVNMESSIDVTVNYEGEVCKEQGKQEIVNEVNIVGSTAVTVILDDEKTDNDGKKQGWVDATVSCLGEASEEKGKAKVVVNEGEREGSVDVTVSCQGDTWKAEKIVEDVNMESLIDTTVNYVGEACKEQGKEIINEVNIVGSTAVTFISDDEKTENDGKKQGWVDATVSCLAEASKEKGKAKVLQEDGGAGTNDSTSNDDKWLLKKCSESSCGLKLSEARFVLYNMDGGSLIQQLPAIDLADSQALEQFSPAKCTGGVEPVKNGIWGNTFFASKRTAKLLGHILAGGFQYTSSLPDIPASSSPPSPSTRKANPRLCKLKARAW